MVNDTKIKTIVENDEVMNFDLDSIFGNGFDYESELENFKDIEYLMNEDRALNTNIIDQIDTENSNVLDPLRLLGENTLYKQLNAQLETERNNLSGEINNFKYLANKSNNRYEGLSKRFSELQNEINKLKSQNTIYSDSYKNEQLGIGMIPPHNIDLESRLLKSLVKHPEFRKGFSQPYLNLMFYKNSHKEIHLGIMRLRKDIKEINKVTLENKLKKFDTLCNVQNELDKFYRLRSYPKTKPEFDKAMIELENLHLLRSLMYLETGIKDIIVNGKKSPLDYPVVETIREIANDVIEKLPFRYRTNHQIENICDKVEEDFNALIGRNGKVKLSTGYPELDKMTYGIHSSKLILVGSRPKMGKTTTMANLAYNLSEQGKSTLIFNYESSKKEITQKIAARIGQFDLEYFESFNGLSQDEFKSDIVPLVKDSMKAARQTNIKYGNVNPYIDHVVAACVMQKQLDPNLELIYIDGLQSFTKPRNYSGNKSDFFYEILNSFKQDVAEKLGVTVIVNAQLKRDVELRKMKIPNRLTDFSDCKGIEEVADKVMTLYRPEEYFSEDSKYSGYMEVIPIALRQGDKRGRKVKLSCNMGKASLYNYNN